MATIRWCPIFPKWDIYQPLQNFHGISERPSRTSRPWRHRVRTSPTRCQRRSGSLSGDGDGVRDSHWQWQKNPTFYRKLLVGVGDFLPGLPHFGEKDTWKKSHFMKSTKYLYVPLFLTRVPSPQTTTNEKGIGAKRIGWMTFCITQYEINQSLAHQISYSKAPIKSLVSQKTQYTPNPLIDSLLP